MSKHIQTITIHGIKHDGKTEVSRVVVDQEDDGTYIVEHWLDDEVVFASSQRAKDTALHVAETWAMEDRSKYKSGTTTRSTDEPATVEQKRKTRPTKTWDEEGMHLQRSGFMECLRTKRQAFHVWRMSDRLGQKNACEHCAETESRKRFKAITEIVRLMTAYDISEDDGDLQVCDSPFDEPAPEDPRTAAIAEIQRMYAEIDRLMAEHKITNLDIFGWPKN